jgi:hypothetical protein
MPVTGSLKSGAGETTALVSAVAAYTGFAVKSKIANKPQYLLDITALLIAEFLCIKYGVTEIDKNQINEKSPVIESGLYDSLHITASILV